MKISWNWLNTKINLHNISYHELSEKLTLAGLEVENIKHNKEIDDTIIELSTAANRPDINSLMSLTTEIAAILKTPIRFNTLTSVKAARQREINPHFQENLNICEKLQISIIHNLNATHYPKCLHNYLVAYDIKPLNNPLDIINFMNLKWGQSIQISALSKSNTFSDINLKLEEDIYDRLKYPTLYLNSKQVYSLKNNSDSLFSHKNNKITSIVIVNIIYKQDYLSSVSHQIAKNLNKSSKAYFTNGISETLELICKLYNTKVDITYTYNSTPKANPSTTINTSINKINQLLGPLQFNTNYPHLYLNEDTIINILKQLKFNILKRDKTLEIQIPENRGHDITREIDIIEEIGRIHGFNNFSDKLPQRQHIGEIPKKTLAINRIRTILRSMGLHEVMHYSLNFNQDTQLETINLYNPLTTDQKQLRTSLIDNLIRAKLHNIKQGNSILEFFEIGRVFFYNAQTQIKQEKIYLSGLLGNPYYNRCNWSDKSHQLSWLQAKGQLENFFESIHMQISWIEPSTNSILFNQIKPYLHSKRTCYIIHKDKIIGIFSQLKSKITKKDHINHDIYLFEIDTNYLFNNIIYEPKHLFYINKPYSNYPRIIRDISIVIHKYIPIQKILNIVQKIQKKSNYLLESVTIFDEYYAPHKKSDTKNVGLRVTYRSLYKTLTNTEIEQIEKSLKTHLEKELMNFDLKSKS
uniref:phenylalanine--tRNA ligase n=1 Tax=Rhodogorgon sp. TaxID=2485824 RepID=A0A3G3MHW8_9FLOR|nr:phenylalanyl-tRNA synthetase beta chain [Rhodogorgon sp.]